MDKEKVLSPQADAQSRSPFPKTLGAFNQYFWIRELVSSNAMLFWAGLRGEMNEVELSRVLSTIMAKYPLLRAKVVKEPGLMPVFLAKNKPIEVCTVEAKIERLEKVLENELKKGSHQEESLFRVVLLRHEPSISTLIFVVNHALTDVRGATVILRDLLSVMSGNPSGDPLNTFFTMEEGFGEPAFENFVQTLPAGEPYLIHDEQLQRSQREVFVATEHLEEDELMALRHRAHQERTTIQAALMAAAARASQALYEPWRSGYSLRLLVPIDARRFFPEQEHVDLLTYPALVSVDAAADIGFWELARTYKAQLKGQETFATGKTFLQQAHHFLSIEMPPQSFLEASNAGFPHELFLSNIGEVKIPESYGSLRIHELGFCTVSGPAPIQSICVTTFRGRMTFSQTSFAPIEGLLSAIRDLLLDAVANN